MQANSNFDVANVKYMETNLVVSLYYDADSEEDHWHYNAKHVHSSRYYENLSKISAIGKENISNPFDKKGKSGMTPLHIALVYKNAAAAEFFLNQGASITVQNNLGLTPEDYAKHYCPKLLGLITQPFPYSYSSTKIKDILSGVLCKNFVKLPDTPCEYRQHTDDFGVEIKELLVLGENDEYNDPFKQMRKDMYSVARRVGFICNNHGYFYLRDFFLKNHTGQLMGSMDPPKEKLPELEIAINRANSKEIYSNTFGSLITVLSNPTLNSHFGSCADFIKSLSNKNSLSLSTSIPSSFYFEGGDVFTLTHSLGIKVLCGKLQLITALNYLRLSKVEVSQEQIKSVSSELSEKKLRKTAEKMYSQGLLKQNDKTGLIYDKQFSTEQLARILFYRSKTKCSFVEAAVQLGYVKKFTWQSSDLDKCREMVAKYLVHKDMAKKLISDSMKVGLKDVIYLPSVFTHLDLFIRPGPKHSIFLCDFKMCEDVCLQILNNAKELNISDNDKAHLEKYIRSAQNKQTQLGPMLAKTRAKLEKAGFTVISMPGMFAYDCGKNLTDKTYNFNLMNAVSGWSSATKKYYYIIGGVEVGNLGTLFMDVLKAFMDQYDPNIEVYFLGRGSDLQKYSESMKILNTLGGQYGNVHCATIEKSTLSHQG